MREARQAAKLSQGEVGQAVALAVARPAGAFSASAVGQWESGKTEPSLGVLLAFLRLTGADPKILFGLQTSELRRPGQLPRGGRLVRKTTAMRAVSGRLEDGAAETVHTHFDCSDKAFAVPVFDSRNAPDYQRGDNVVIDPAEEPQPGDIVLAKCKEAPVLGVFEMRDGCAQITALNKRWDTVRLNIKRGDRIIGVMTEHARPRRQH